MFALWNRPAYRIAMLTAISFAVFMTNTARMNRLGPVPGLVLNTVAAVQITAASAASWVAGVASRYLFLVGAAERLEQVEAERNQLLAERDALIELGHENERLRALSELRDSLGGDLLAARIIGVADEKSTLIIDRGHSDGLATGQAVVSMNGIVGQVWYTGRYTSTVLLLSDPRSRVPVYNARTRARGIVEGGGYGRGLLVSRVRRTEDVRPGDLLISAGSGLIFPRGLPVARIVRVEDPGMELVIPVTATEAAGVDYLDEVMVVRTRGGLDVEPGGEEAQPPAAVTQPPVTSADTGPRPPEVRQ